LHGVDPNQDDHDVNVATDAKAEGKFGCDVSHVNKYAGIAEKSMEKFASLISSFRYNPSGSHASGLRAPLKEVQNTRSMRYTVLNFLSLLYIIYIFNNISEVITNYKLS
jgi:exonuclease 1